MLPRRPPTYVGLPSGSLPSHGSSTIRVQRGLFEAFVDLDLVDADSLGSVLPQNLLRRLLPLGGPDADPQDEPAQGDLVLELSCLLAPERAGDQGTDAAGCSTPRRGGDHGHGQRAAGSEHAERRGGRADVGEDPGSARERHGDVLARPEEAPRSFRQVGQFVRGGIDAAELFHDRIGAGHDVDVRPVEPGSQQSADRCFELLARVKDARHLAHLDPLACRRHWLSHRLLRSPALLAIRFALPAPARRTVIKWGGLRTPCPQGARPETSARARAVERWWLPW